MYIRQRESDSIGGVKYKTQVRYAILVYNFFMCKAIKRLLLRLLVVILALNAFQIGFAAEPDRDNSEKSGQNFQQPAVAAIELDNTDPCKSEHKVHCFNLQGCTSSVNGNSMLSGNSYLDLVRVIIKLGYIKKDSALITNYPKLLKRPPIA
jgi:hypothetical protein